MDKLHPNDGKNNHFSPIDSQGRVNVSILVIVCDLVQYPLLAMNEAKTIVNILLEYVSKVEIIMDKKKQIDL